MGIPYSKEINAAFEQVTPLVAAGFEVLQTTKNIAILLAVIQVVTVVTLNLILVALIGLLFTMNPDMDAERKQLVTPVMRWLAEWIFAYGTYAKWLLRILLFVSTVALCIFLWQGSLAGVNAPAAEDEEDSELDKGNPKKGNEDSKEKDSKSEKDKSKK